MSLDFDTEAECCICHQVKPNCEWTVDPYIEEVYGAEAEGNEPEWWCAEDWDERHHQV